MAKTTVSPPRKTGPVHAKGKPVASNPSAGHAAGGRKALPQPSGRALPATPAPASRKPAPAAAPAPTPSPALPQREQSGDVDPLLKGGQEPLKLVGGHHRDAQLPTTLVPKLDLPAAVPLTVHAQAVPGGAHSGNSQPANILVLVSCGGWPVVDLNEDHFSVMEHFGVPGQVAPFSNNIVSFRNNGSGAYLLQVRPIGGAPWASGQHLAQILVSSPDDRHGQTAAKLIIR